MDIGEKEQTQAFVFHCPLNKEGSVIRLDILSKASREILKKLEKDAMKAMKAPVVTKCDKEVLKALVVT